MKATVIFKKQSIPADHFIVDKSWGLSHTDFICEQLVKKLAARLPDNAYEMKVDITINYSIIKSLNGENDGKINNNI